MSENFQPTLEPLRVLGVNPQDHPHGRAHVGAASGLVCANGRAYVVADDEHHLAVFDDVDRPGALVRLFAGTLPVDRRERKRAKPDLEALLALTAAPAWPHGALLALGSGSRPQRRRGVLVPFAADGSLDGAAVRAIDLSPLYGPLERRFGELNIEGAMLTGDHFVLFQRGNRGPSVHATARYRADTALQWLAGEAAHPPRAWEIRHHDLGACDGIPLAFTDATPLPDGRALFTAVAEDTDDAYADGGCAGSAIGLMDADGGVASLAVLPGREKLEGIAARIGNAGIDACVVSDADDPEVPSRMSRVRALPFV